jgi:hypothetical protein
MIHPLDLIAKRIVAKGFFLNHADIEAKMQLARESYEHIWTGGVRAADKLSTISLLHYLRPKTCELE